MQVSYQYGGGIGSGVGGSSIFGCTTIFYVGNENENENNNENDPTTTNNKKGGKKKNLRQEVIDPDVPMTSYIQKKEVTNTEIETEVKTETLISNIPKFVIDPLFQHEQNRIDQEMTPEARCQQFGVEALPHDQQQQRRLFFGSMLANENSEVLIAHAIEVYQKYDVISFVESNTTHFQTPRELNYPPDSFAARTLLDSELFGSATKTKVYIDYWLEDEPLLTHMHREQEQRNTIWKRWIAAGMRPQDIGVMADLDEVVSRDFLNALQVCDFPLFRYEEDPDKRIRPDCQTPKMALSTIQYEGSPGCIKKYVWFHPDLLMGHCILGVGDNAGRASPVRWGKDSHHNKMVGMRIEEWGARDYKLYPQDVIDNKRFPLWDGRDIREINGNEAGLTDYVNLNTTQQEAKDKGAAVYGTAFHLHNWFNSLEVLRHKYATYGHAFKEAVSVPLSKIQGDLDTLVRCNRKIGNENIPADVGVKPDDAFPYYEINDQNEVNGVKFSGSRPIFFLNTTYAEERNTLVTQLIVTDEKKYGSYYRNEELGLTKKMKAKDFSYYVHPTQAAKTKNKNDKPKRSEKE